ncbi:MAG TPA: sucrase ferredoxin [Gaiellaceae bacterium]|nr:sucrase ferredoxin [Gaiellaceae bacterium]
MSAERCSDLSRQAGEPLAGTATTALRWLVLEIPGTWPRDVSAPEALPERAREALDAWLASAPRSRLLFVRRPRRSAPVRLAFRVDAHELGGEVRRFELDRPDDLADADLDAGGTPTGRPLVLVCGHGSRDGCCALRGTAVFAALAGTGGAPSGPLGEEELWLSSHHGGHRFAANVLVLPAGLHFGRVEPGEAPALVARALAGEIELARYRGRTCYEPHVQAAEHALREALALRGLGDLRYEGGEGTVVRFRTRDGRERSVRVEETRGPAVPASCGSAPEPQRAFSARIL